MQRRRPHDDHRITHRDDTDAVGDNSAEQRPSPCSGFYQLLEAQLGHAGIMLQLNGSYPAIITHNACKTGQRTAAYPCKRR